MSKFSKLFGALIGSLIGLGASFGLTFEWLTPEIQATIVTVLATLGTFLAPANKA